MQAAGRLSAAAAACKAVAVAAEGGGGRGATEEKLGGCIQSILCKVGEDICHLQQPKALISEAW
jgi:hypothetical protein